MPRLYEEARVALQVGQRLAGRSAVTNFAGLGLYRLISNVSQAELRAFVRDTLGPVLDLPEPARSDLLKSPAVLCGTRFNVAESARILHYHYNTMRYRVTKLERMLGKFVDAAAATFAASAGAAAACRSRRAGVRAGTLAAILGAPLHFVTDLTALLAIRHYTLTNSYDIAAYPLSGYHDVASYVLSDAVSGNILAGLVLYPLSWLVLAALGAAAGTDLSAFTARHAAHRS